MPKPIIFAIVVSALLLAVQLAFPQKLPVGYYCAQAALDNREVSKAIQWSDSATVASPKSHWVWLIKGESLLHASRVDEAIASFKRADEIRAGSASYGLARSYALANDTSNAIASLQRHLELTPKLSEAQITLDTAFTNLAKTMAWRKLWLNQWYTANEILTADAAYHARLGEWDYIIDITSERMQRKSFPHSLFAIRGEAYFNLASFKSAESDFERAVKRSRRNSDYQAWYGRALAKTGKASKAIRALTQAIEMTGGKPIYYLYRAQALGIAGNFEGAISDAKHYLSFYPACIEGIALLAELAVENGNRVDALLMLGKLIVKEPKNSKYRLMRAGVYAQSGLWEMAEIDLNELLKVAPNSTEALLLRGTCRHSLGKLVEACDDWRWAVKQGNFQAQEKVYKHCK